MAIYITIDVNRSKYSLSSIQFLRRRSILIRFVTRFYFVQGYIVSFLVDPGTGRLVKGRRLEIQPSARVRGPVVTCISFTAWQGRGGRNPSLLVSCASNALYLYK